MAKSCRCPVRAAVFFAWILLLSCSGIQEDSGPDLSQYRSRSCPECPEFLVDIRNFRDNPIDIFWINFQGDEVHYGTCESGEVLSQPTSVADVWVIREKGVFLQTIIHPPGRMTVEVR